MSLVVECCPFLGCTEDRDSVCGYPTAVNVCYSLSTGKKRFRGASIARQTTYCLGKYQACDLYNEGLSVLSSGTPVPVRLPLTQRLVRRLLRPLFAR